MRRNLRLRHVHHSQIVQALKKGCNGILGLPVLVNAKTTLPSLHQPLDTRSREVARGIMPERIVTGSRVCVVTNALDVQSLATPCINPLSAFCN